MPCSTHKTQLLLAQCAVSLDRRTEWTPDTPAEWSCPGAEMFHGRVIRIQNWLAFVCLAIGTSICHTMWHGSPHTHISSALTVCSGSCKQPLVLSVGITQIYLSCLVLNKIVSFLLIDSSMCRNPSERGKEVPGVPSRAGQTQLHHSQKLPRVP